MGIRSRPDMYTVPRRHAIRMARSGQNITHVNQKPYAGFFASSAWRSFSASLMVGPLAGMVSCAGVWVLYEGKSVSCQWAMYSRRRLNTPERAFVSGSAR